MAIDHEKLHAARMKAMLDASPVLRRQELASFILSVSSLAQDLLKMSKLVSEQGVTLTPAVEDAMAYIEREINKACAKRLGCRLTETQNTPNTADSSPASERPRQS